MYKVFKDGKELTKKETQLWIGGMTMHIILDLLYEAGFDNSEIAKIARVPLSAVERHVEAYKKEED